MSVYTITFGKQLCRTLSIKYTPQVDLFLRAWAQAEGSRAANNPFATTQPAPADTRYPTGWRINFNTVGVKNYPTWRLGVDMTAKTLLNGRYGPILTAMRTGTSATAMAKALASTPWGTGPLALRVLTEGDGPRAFPFGNCYPSPPTAWSRTITVGMDGPDVDELLRGINRRLGYGPEDTRGYKWFSVAAGDFCRRWRLKRPWLWPAKPEAGPKTFDSITGHR